MIVNGRKDIWVDGIIQAKDKTHGFMGLRIYVHDCSIILKRHYRSTKLTATS